MRRLVALSAILSSAALVCLLAVVAASILARILFDLTDGGLNFLIPGAIEAARYALLILVFAALPLAAREGLIRADFLTARLPRLLRAGLDRLWLLLAAAAGALMAWSFAEKTLETFGRGDATQDLQLPLFVFYAFLSLASALFAVSASVFALLPDGGGEQAS